MHTLNRAGATPAEERFPNPSCPAMDVLPAQASAVPCEHLFSSGKRLPLLAATNSAKTHEALQPFKLSSRNTHSA